MPTARTILLSAICLIPLHLSAQSCVIEPTRLNSATATVRYEQQFSLKGTALGDATYQLVSGALPAGLSLSPSGVLSGTTDQGGVFRFTVRARAFSFLTVSTCEKSTDFDLTVIDRRCRPITFSSVWPPHAVAGSPYQYTVAVGGGSEPYGYFVTSGALPEGLRLSPTGVISGTPAAPGLASATITAIDGNQCKGSAEMPLGVFRDVTLGAARSVAMSGTTVVIGSPDPRVLRWDGTQWRRENFVLPGDLQPGQSFGQTVAVSGDRIAVGAPSQSGRGAVYVFQRLNGQWVQEARFEGIGERDGFGGALSLSGTDLIVGARQRNRSRGAAFFYSRQSEGWVAGQELANPQQNDTGAMFFGEAVAIDGNIAAVGSPSGPQGAVFIFERAEGTWNLKVRVTIPERSNRIGREIALSGETLLTTGDITVGRASDSVFVFERQGGTWPLRATLEDADFGHGLTVALSGNTALLGTTTGAYVARRSAGIWRVENKLGGEGAPFPAVAVSGNRLVRTIGEGNVLLLNRCPETTARPATQWRGAVGTRASLRASEDLPAGLTDYVAADGTLPPGMSLGVDGMISGTPSALGSYSFTVMANDAQSCSVSVPVTLTVERPCRPFVLDGGPLPSGLTGLAYTGRLRASGGATAGEGGASSYRFEPGMSSLPPGLRLSTDGVLSGTPSRAGTYSFEIVVRDSGLCPPVSLPVTLVVFPTVSVPSDDSVTGGAGAAADLVGKALAIHGTMAIVGAPGSLGGRGSAAILVKAPNGWIRQATLTAAESADGDAFGSAVSISGDRVIVGAPGYERERGAAYVFERGSGGWNQIARLTAADGVSGDAFGFAVGISSETAVVGAPFSKSRRGTAYSFLRTPTGWSPETMLAPEDNDGHEYGYAVSLSGDGLVIGAPGHPMIPGAAYVCERPGTGWACSRWSALVSGDRLGESVAISGSRALIGVPSVNFVAALRRGPMDWELEKNVDSPDGTAGTRFGASIALNGSTAIIGAPGKANGAAYLYVYDSGWAPRAELGSPIASAYGSAVAHNGHTSLVGGSGTFQILERCPDSRITVTPDRVTPGAEGAPYTLTFSASGGDGPYVFDFSEGAPYGLFLSQAGAMTGRPAVTGAFPFTVTARDRNGCTGSRGYSLLVQSSCGSLTAGPETIPGGVVSLPYSQRLTAQGGAAPYTFSINTGLFGSGSLPAGFQLSTSGELTGTPVNAGTFNIAIRVRDASGCEAVKAYTFNIATTATSRVLRVVPAGAGPGDNVAVDVELLAQGDETTLGFSLRYDAAALGDPRIAPGRDVAGGQLNVNMAQAAAGRVGVLLAMPQGRTLASGARRIVTVTFRVGQSVTANSTEIAFDDQPVVREVTNAAAAVLAATYLSGPVTISRGPEADVSPRPTGNGTVTAADWAQVGRFVAGAEKPENGSEFQRADCAPKETRGDGQITMADWVQAGRYADGSDPVVAAGGPMEPVSGGGGMSMQRAGRGARAASSIRAAPSTEAGLGTIQVSLDAAGVESGAAFTVQFDPARWRFVSASPDVDAAGATVIINSAGAAEGRVRMAMAFPAGQRFQAGTRQLVTVSLERIPGEAELAPEISDAQVVDHQARVIF